MAYKWENRKQLMAYVARRLSNLQSGFLNDKPQARAQLANLRQSVTSNPGEDVGTWELEFGGLPESLVGKGSQPATEGEWASHLAFTLYAVHQQSKSVEMYRRTNVDQGELFGLGHAAKRLTMLDGEGKQLEQGEMPGRFAALVTAATIEEVAHYTRQLVQQFRSASIPLDYGYLAGQLYAFQFPYMRNRVLLEWSREFNQWINVGEQDGEENDGSK